MGDGTNTVPRAPVAAHRLPSPARALLAVLLLAMAAGQLSDVVGFAGVLAGYRALPDPLLVPAAWVLASAEAMTGVALLRSRRCGGILALAVAVAWAALALQAFARGLPLDNCGCFGVHLGQPLRWWVLLEDAEFVALAAWVRRAERRTPRPSSRAPASCGAPRLRLAQAGRAAGGGA